MKTLILIAWRNIWRNRSRTIITVVAIVVAVFLSTVMTSMQEGTYTKMIENVVRFYSGYIQIHHPEYWENKTINNTFSVNDSLLVEIENIEGVEYVAERLESFTLLSMGEDTRGGALIGIDTEKEDELTNLSHWIDTGAYLLPNDDGVLITYNQALNIKAKVGDTLVLISQGYHGASAAGLAPIRGILKFTSPQLNNLGAYMEIEHAREFFSADNLSTSLVFMLQNQDYTNSVKREIEMVTGELYSVKTWEEMQPELKQMITADRSGGIIMKAILYIIIGFGVFSTVIMMVNERKRELGVLVAIGMKKTKLATVLFIETVFIGILGILSGFLVSAPIILAFVKQPIPLTGEVAEAYESFGLEPAMYFSGNSEVFMRQILIVFAITSVVALYPVLKIIFLELSKTLRA